MSSLFAFFIVGYTAVCASAQERGSAMDELKRLAPAVERRVPPEPKISPAVSAGADKVPVDIIMDRVDLELVSTRIISADEAAKIREKLEAFPLRRGLLLLAIGRPQSGEPGLRFKAVDRRSLDHGEGPVFGQYDSVSNIIAIGRDENSGNLDFDPLIHELYHALDDVLMIKTKGSRALDSMTLSDVSPVLKEHYLALLARCGGTEAEPLKSDWLCLSRYFGPMDYPAARTSHEYFVYHFQALTDQAQRSKGDDFDSFFRGSRFEAAVRAVIDSPTLNTRLMFKP